MDGQTVLITGAGGLLGKTHAYAALELGANVVLTDVSMDSIFRLAEELKANFTEQTILSLEMDVTKKLDVQEVADALIRSALSPDVLINNAALNPLPHELGLETRFENLSLEKWKWELEVTLTGAFICCQIFGSQMALRRRGVILNMASDLAVIAPNQNLYSIEGLNSEIQPVKPATYSVSKTGLLGLTRYLATYWANQNVRVNALSPGGIKSNQNEEFLKRFAKLVPMARMGEADELSGIVQFLISPASSYMTGQNVIVDGGRSVW